VDQTFEQRGLMVYGFRRAARIRDQHGWLDLSLRNVSERPLRELELSVESKACRAQPLAIAELGPAQLVHVHLKIEREPGVAEEQYPLHLVAKAAGLPWGHIEMQVDTRRTVTLEDQGFIPLAVGSIQPAPGRWHLAVFALVPVLLVGGFVLARGARRGKGEKE